MKSLLKNREKSANGMYTYSYIQFFIANQILTDPKYSNPEYSQYMEPFITKEFEAPILIKSMMLSLAIPSNSRVCNVFCYDCFTEEMGDYAPKHVGMLTLTLWKGETPEVKADNFVTP